MFVNELKNQQIYDNMVDLIFKIMQWIFLEESPKFNSPLKNLYTDKFRKKNMSGYFFNLRRTK